MPRADRHHGDVPGEHERQTESPRLRLDHADGVWRINPLAKGTGYIGIEQATAHPDDNGTDRAITVLSSLASDTYIDVAALIVNRRAGTTASSGAKYGKVFYAGASGDLAMLTGTASPSVGTDVTADGTIDLSDLFNDDEAMGLAIASIGGTARAITLDRWELSFNV